MLRTTIATAGCAVLIVTCAAGLRAEPQLPRPAPRPTGILGSADHRVPIAPTVWPWSSIGRVNVVAGPAARGHCTGTLVGPRHVLTAAHCLFNARLNAWVKPNQVHFVAGQSRDGKFEGNSAAAGLIINPGFSLTLERKDRIGAEMIPRDWAIVTLEKPLALRPIPVQVLNRTELPSAAAPGEISRAGYSQDRPFALSIHRGCSARTDAPAPGAVLHQCDSMPGDSGAPILLLRLDDASIIGIHTAIQTAFEPGVGHRTLAAFGVAASAFSDAVEAAVRKPD